MTDPAVYRKYAEECLRLATTVPENDRRLLMEHADVWLKLADGAEPVRCDGGVAAAPPGTRLAVEAFACNI